MTDIVRIHAIVHGAVQGVGFRYSATTEAARNGISGFIRNLRDGTVEAEAEGPRASVALFIDWLRAGPPGARVEVVETSEREPTGSTGFELRH